MNKLLLFFILLLIGCGKVNALPYTFSLVPRVIDTHAHNKKVILSLLQLPDLELKAIHKNNKTRFIYSQSLKALMKEMGLTKADFKPFRAYLIRQIKKAKKCPGKYVTMLGTYLTSGATVDFTVNIN